MSFVLQFLYLLTIKILAPFFTWIPELQTRVRFEKKNKRDPRTRSFKFEGIKADYCFEFSSEGEYQQVAPLITDALKEGKKLELIFFSPSVEKAIEELAAQHPTQIRYLRYPLIVTGFHSWITAKNLILVRYDLFPEFLIWSLKKEHHLKMVWVSFKKERIKGKKVSFFKKTFLAHAESIIYASGADEATARELGFKGSHYDFRMEQIKRRMELKDFKFQEKFSLYPELNLHLERYPAEKKVIMGNAWVSDIFLLEKLPADYLVMIVPHKLDPENIEAIQDGLEALGRKALVLNDGQGPILPANTFILNKKGVLCELYSDFSKAYVGGGFHTSVHSILEPLVAGSYSLACGPLHHRSTEFDVALSYGKIIEVKDSEGFFNWVTCGPKAEDNLNLSKDFARYPEFRKEVISC
jgi:3-deoxy-D-manno-octulosonic-acid transferase